MKKLVITIGLLLGNTCLFSMDPELRKEGAFQYASNYSLGEELSQAIDDDDIEKVKECLKKGADINAKSFSKSPRSRALLPLLRAVKSHNIPITRLLLEHGANVQAGYRDFIYNTTCLLDDNCEYERDLNEGFIQLFHEYKADFKEPSLMGSYLMKHEERFSLSTFQLILEKSNPNTPCSFTDRTPLEYIAERKTFKENLIALLLAHGGDPLLTSKRDGKNTFELIVENPKWNKRDRARFKQMMIATFKKKIEEQAGFDAKSLKVSKKKKRCRKSRH